MTPHQRRTWRTPKTIIGIMRNHEIRTILRGFVGGGTLIFNQKAHAQWVRYQEVFMAERLRKQSKTEEVAEILCAKKDWLWGNDIPPWWYYVIKTLLGCLCQDENWSWKTETCPQSIKWFLRGRCAANWHHNLPHHSWLRTHHYDHQCHHRAHPTLNSFKFFTST